MRYLTSEDLIKILPGPSYEWKQAKIDFYVSGRPVAELLHSTKKVLKCLKCSSHFFLEECGNCGADESLGKALFAIEGGLACLRGDFHFDKWTCPECGCQNPVIKTLYVPNQKDSSCFIATAVYGSHDCREVEMLRGFRDTVLLPLKYGRRIIQWYYRNSPPLADFLRRHHTIRNLFRLMILGPVVRILEQRFFCESSHSHSKQQRTGSSMPDR